MRKLRLNLDDLIVSSFVPSPKTVVPGTVRGHGYTQDFNQCGGTMPGACESNGLGCATVGGTCAPGCTYYMHWTCAGYNSCQQPCNLSDASNCHYCTENQTDYSYCPDNESLCVCY